jgi:hypothetical protein
MDDRELSSASSASAGGPDERESERPYLSIGEVLEVLKAEFEGVSIAQVRELESRGLFTPERTASGYRKFYDADLGRLRDLLTRHGPSLSRPVRGRTASGAASIENGEPSALPETQRRIPNAPSAFSATSPSERLPGDPERRHPSRARRARAEAALASLGDRGPEETGPTPMPEATEQVPGAQVPPNPSTTGPAIATSTSRPRTGRHADRTLALVHPTPPAKPAAASSSSPSDAEADAEPVDGVVRAAPPKRPLGGVSSGVSLSINELCAASGLTPEHVHELESQGLVRGRTVFSETFYDEDALLVSNLARMFLGHGIEPRHLRMFRLTAEREAAFYEQVVLRRRNPEARAEAMQSLERMLELGEQLRSIAVRQVLRASIER